MRRAAAIIRSGQIDARRVVDRIALDHDRRYRRRLVLQTVQGESLLLDFAQAQHLRHGDGLLLDDGAVVLVEALPEPLVEIRVGDPAELIRIAWHLGNRHLPTQLLGDCLRIREDHVIAEMVRHLGGTATPIHAPFDPEGGAYGDGAAHHHGPDALDEEPHARGHDHG